MIKIVPRNLIKLAILLLLANILIIGALYFRMGIEHPYFSIATFNIVGGSLAVFSIAVVFNITRKP